MRDLRTFGISKQVPQSKKKTKEGRKRRKGKRKRKKKMVEGDCGRRKHEKKMIRMWGSVEFSLIVKYLILKKSTKFYNKIVFLIKFLILLQKFSTKKDDKKTYPGV